MAIKPNFQKALNVNARNNAGDELRKIESSKSGYNFKIVPYEKIKPSDLNKFPKTSVEEIEESIERVGLIHNLLLVPIEDEIYDFEILSGEQRYWAIGNLIKKGNERFAAGVPSNVIDRNTSIVDRQIIIEEANIKQRSYEPQLIRESINRLDELYKQKNAVDNTKLSVNKQISEATGLNERQVQRYKAINNKLIPDLQTAFDESKISVEKAAQFANMDNESQLLIVELLKSNRDISKKEIELLKEESKKKEEDLLNKINELDNQVNTYDELNKKLEIDIQSKDIEIKSFSEKEENIRKEIEDELSTNHPDQSKINELNSQIEKLQFEKQSTEQEKNDIKQKLDKQHKEYLKLQKELEEVQNSNNEVSAIVLSEEEKSKLKENYELSNIISSIKKDLNQLYVKSESYQKKYKENLMELYSDLEKKLIEDKEKIMKGIV